MTECICDRPLTQPVTVCPLHPHAWKRGKMQGREISEDELPEALRQRRTAPTPTTAAERNKLRLDAENVLTWPAPSSDADVLMFGHLRRFAKATLELDAALLVARRENETIHSLRERVALLEGVIRECRKCEQAALYQVEGMEEQP